MLYRQAPDTPSGIRARAGQAQYKLFAKFGYDMRRPRPAALANTAYRIFKSLPEELLTTIRSAHRKYEAEAQANRLLEKAYRLMEERQHVAIRDGGKMIPRGKGVRTSRLFP
jgi:hypothetical protein